jgi:hypothetical protein
MPSPSARRRQRSTRLVVAVVLLTTAACLVAVAFLGSSAWFQALAAVSAVVLGAAATRITHSELMQTRRDWGRDRAEQAQAYRDLDLRRTSEHADYVSGVKAEARRREEAILELEQEVVVAQHRAAEATRKLSAEARRAELAESEGVRLGRQVEEAEQRAAEAIVHLAELEQEVQVLRAELDAWQAMADEQVRRHA